MKGEMMKEGNRIETGDVILADGTVRTEADYERMALEAETTLPDMERLKARRRSGRPSLGDGESPILNVRLDAETRVKLNERARREHSTPSGLVRDAIKAFLEAS